MLNELILELRKEADPVRAKHSQRFFKTGNGEYGEGDIFIGLTMPQQREIAKRYTDLKLEYIQKLIDSKIHEYRMTGLIILVGKYKKAKKDLLTKRKIYEFYTKNAEKINNWDLVDVTCTHIVGDFCLREGTGILRDFANSDNLWKKRIAMVSTFPFIKKRNFGETLAIAEMLIDDEHDLIHKAVGWGLREVGKKNLEVLELFLKPRYKTMPRTMLRYAIEKFPEEKRKRYLSGEI